MLKICAIIASIIISVSCYTTCGIVTSIDDENNIVEITDFNGEIWVYEGVEDYLIGDAVSMLMNNNGTENIYDDIIINIRYCGYIN